MYTTNNRHNWLSSVPGHAEALHQQGARFHIGVLDVQSPESRRVEANLRGDQRNQRTGSQPNTDHVNWKQVR